MNEQGNKNRKYKTPAFLRARVRRWHAENPEYGREYNRRPEVKARRRELARARRAALVSDPKKLATIRANHRDWRRTKMEDPEYRARLADSGREYRKQHRDQINARRRVPQIVDPNQVTLSL